MKSLRSPLNVKAQARRIKDRQKATSSSSLHKDHKQVYDARHHQHSLLDPHSHEQT